MPMPLEEAEVSRSISPSKALTSDRDALALLAADALLDVEVGAERVHRGDHAGAVADQVGATHGGGDLAVLDQVALRHAEHELTGDRVDLPPAEPLGVQATRGLPDDLLGIVVAGEDVGVGHARD